MNVEDGTENGIREKKSIDNEQQEEDKTLKPHLPPCTQDKPTHDGREKIDEEHVKIPRDELAPIKGQEKEEMKKPAGIIRSGDSPQVKGHRKKISFADDPLKGQDLATDLPPLESESPQVAKGHRKKISFADDPLNGHDLATHTIGFHPPPPSPPTDADKGEESLEYSLSFSDISEGDQESSHQLQTSTSPPSQTPIKIPKAPRPKFKYNAMPQDFGTKENATMRRRDDLKIERMKDKVASMEWNRDDDSVSSSSSDSSGRSIDRQTMAIRDAERFARSKAVTNKFLIFLLTGYAAVKVFLKYLVSLDVLFGALLSAGMTVYVYYRTEGDEEWSAGMDYVLLGFAVITPMSVSLSYSFRRREVALFDIANFRSLALQVYLCFALWKWKDPSSHYPKEDGSTTASSYSQDTEWLNLCDEVLQQLIGISDELCRFLTLPTATASRHRVTKSGKREAARTIEVAYQLLDSIVTKRFTALNMLCETARDTGLTGAESSRLQGWERSMVECIDNLRVAKMYRTPEAMRAFARLFTTLLPPFYAPNFAQIARDNSLGLGIAFAILTSVALTALLSAILILEDPFVAYITLDGIDCREEFSVLYWHQLINARKLIFPWAFPFPKYRIDETGFVKGVKAIEGSANNEEDILNKSVKQGLSIRVSAYSAITPSEDSVDLSTSLKKAFSIRR